VLQVNTDLNAEIDALIDEFDVLGDWEERYHYLIEMGQALPDFSEDDRTDETRVKGCVSQVWLVLDDGVNRVLKVRGDSDAHIVKGLVALMIRLYDGRSPRDALSIDPKSVLGRIGLSEHLSPQRSNGLISMVRRIQAEARSRL